MCEGEGEGGARRPGQGADSIIVHVVRGTVGTPGPRWGECVCVDLAYMHARLSRVVWTHVGRRAGCYTRRRFWRGGVVSGSPQLIASRLDHSDSAKIRTTCRS